MLGVPGGQVIIAEWSERWAALYEQEKLAIEHELGSAAAAVHHIGSTAVAQLSAKPILDIAIESAEDTGQAECIAGLERLGYVNKGDGVLPDRFYLTKGSPRTHQIHLYPEASPYLRKHLAFRDRLRSDEQDRLAYEQLKRRLAEQYGSDRIAYADAKTDFIQSILRKIGIE